MCGSSLFQNADVEPGIKDNYWLVPICMTQLPRHYLSMMVRRREPAH